VRWIALILEWVVAVGAACQILGWVGGAVVVGVVVVQRSPRLACGQDPKMATPPIVARPLSTTLYLRRPMDGPVVGLTGGNPWATMMGRPRATIVRWRWPRRRRCYASLSFMKVTCMSRVKIQSFGLGNINALALHPS
jgi:hypothetical protein